MGLFDFLLGNANQSQAQSQAQAQAQQAASQQAIMQGLAMMGGSAPQQPVTAPQYAPAYAAHPITYQENMDISRGILSDSKRRKDEEDEEDEKKRKRGLLQPISPDIGFSYDGR